MRKAGCKVRSEPTLKRFVRFFQQLRRRFQHGQFILCAEGKIIYKSQPFQDGNAAQREMLRVPDGKRCRQFQHQISSVFQRRSRADARRK